ncbi:MAG: ABC transporter ATP-binding protein [Planctomycetota bacterium]|jgi:ABC-type multidrug transport system ATPase subunit|nr:ABC transporter ATP-binding protein [Planctomycetota bacterium]
MKQDVPAIEVKNLSKKFSGRLAVRDLSLRVNRGEILGFLGPNGSGKTTAFRMLCGLLTPDSGEGYCLGYDIRRENAWIKRHIGYMTQRFSLWEDLTVRENLAFVAQIHRLKDRRRRVREIMAEYGLAEVAGELASHLSGGWKQRLALAAALVHQPELLLLDEPTAGVDPAARRDFWDNLHHLAHAGLAILVSTHYMDEAERCHKLVCLAAGRVLEQGTAREIVARQNLHAYQVGGKDLALLARSLAGKPGVAEAIVFGNCLTVVGSQREELVATLASLPPEYPVSPAETGLEEAFIYLMGQREKER